MNRDEFLNLFTELEWACTMIHNRLEDMETPPTKNDYLVAINTMPLTPRGKTALTKLSEVL